MLNVHLDIPRYKYAAILRRLEIAELAARYREIFQIAPKEPLPKEVTRITMLYAIVDKMYGPENDG